MKKILSLIFLFLLSFSLVACNENGGLLGDLGSSSSDKLVNKLKDEDIITLVSKRKLKEMAEMFENVSKQENLIANFKANVDLDVDTKDVYEYFWGEVHTEIEQIKLKGSIDAHFDTNFNVHSNITVSNFERFYQSKSEFSSNNYDEKTTMSGTLTANFYNVSSRNRMYLDINAALTNDGTKLTTEGKYYQDIDVLDQIQSVIDFDTEDIDIDEILDLIDYDDINEFLVMFEDIITFYHGKDYLGVKVHITKELLSEYLEDLFGSDIDLKDIVKFDLTAVIVVTKDSFVVDIKADININSTDNKIKLVADISLAPSKKFPKNPNFDDYIRKDFEDILDSLV